METAKLNGLDPEAYLREVFELCVDGAGTTPSDDCGGAPGYMDFVRAMADPYHEEHTDMKRWIGRDIWDSAAFDIHNINSWLAEIKL